MPTEPTRAARRRRGEPVDGVLLLDKPPGMTSNAALQAAKRLLEAAKAGHTGTLDPLASGLLPLCFGEATKLSAYLLDADKAYTARVALGARTTTGDAEGEIVETRPVVVDAPALEAALARFRGRIEQVPPMHSALKRAGRPLYDYARAGIDVPREPRTVTIASLGWRDLAADGVTLEVVCSKGTYIRVLAEDLGAALGCGAHLAALRRTAIGPFDIAGAVTLDALAGLPLARRRAALRPADSLVAALPVVELDAGRAAGFRNGQPIPGVAPRPGTCRVYCGGRLLGLGEAGADGVLRPRRVILEAAA